MNKLFTLAAAAVLFGTGIVGCSNTADGAKQDAATDTAAVQKAGATAVDKTVNGTEKAVAATEQGAANAAATTEKAAATAVQTTKDAATTAAAVTEKTAANAVQTTKDAASNAAAATEKTAAAAVNGTKKAVDTAAAGVEKTAAKTGEVMTHAGKVVTVVPTIKTALLADDTVCPKGGDASKYPNVDMDSDGKTIHLRGEVTSNDAKKKAEQIAKNASKGNYTISND